MVTSVDLWEERLRAEGYRLTAARHAVIATVAGSVFALSPLEIYDRAREHCRGLGLMSVYRTLEKLERLHLIQRVHQPENCQAFIASSPGHQHLLLCQHCGQVAFFEGDDLEELTDAISGKTGYQIREHWLQLFGLCRKCSQDKDL